MLAFPGWKNYGDNTPLTVPPLAIPDIYSHVTMSPISLHDIIPSGLCLVGVGRERLAGANEGLLAVFRSSHIRPRLNF